MIKSISAAPSFKGYIPVKHYALYPKDHKFWQVTKHENLTKCQSFVTRNLNGTTKNMKNQRFVDFYKSQDKDYAANPVVHSVYDEKKSTIYMVTGNDTDAIRQEAKSVGRAKSEAIAETGRAESNHVKKVSKEFMKNAKKFITTSCRQVKAQNGDKLELQMYFIPQYNKDGKLKGFQYFDARFAKDETK